jgi:hypothetical protein
MSVEHPEIGEVKGSVRADLFLGGWILEAIDHNNTKAIYTS